MHPSTARSYLSLLCESSIVSIWHGSQDRGPASDDTEQIRGACASLQADFDAILENVVLKAWVWIPSAKYALLQIAEDVRFFFIP
jgi:hypothetical protein